MLFACLPRTLPFWRIQSVDRATAQVDQITPQPLELDEEIRFVNCRVALYEDLSDCAEQTGILFVEEFTGSRRRLTDKQQTDG